MLSPLPIGEQDSGNGKNRKGIRSLGAWVKAVGWERHDLRLWIETVWFLFVDWAVGYVFLNWRFRWEGEEEVQRFMW